MLLSFNVEKQIITRTDTEKVVTNSMNYLYAQFSFSNEWTGEKTAVFKGKHGAYNALLDAENKCLVPWEILTEAMFDVSVFCGDLITANKVKIFTIPSGYEVGDESRIPTPEIYTQVINRLNEIEADIHSIPMGGTVGQFLTKKSNSNYDTEWSDASGGVTPQDVDDAISAVNGIVDASAFEPITSTVINKYIQNRTGQLFDNNEATLMEFSVQEGEQYRITGSYRWKLAIMGIYNGNSCVDTYPNDDVSRDNLTTETITITIPTGITTLRACSYQRPLTVEKLEPNGKSVDFSANILYGKKWAVCGDSFTCGDFTGYVDKQGHSGTDSDAYDTATQSWKTYSWWISQRNKMNVQALAMGGNSFTNLSGATRPFSNPNTSTYNYTQIANDCDYITLAFGLNESGLTTEQIGTKTDTTNATLWGAYNVVLEAILTANPSVKIGIIVTDAWLSQTYHDALIGIAKYWGIPYLDLRNGDEVPMMIGGELREHSTTARTLRNSAFSIDGSNSGHPTPLGFKYRSTVIENFLRSL